MKKLLTFFTFTKTKSAALCDKMKAMLCCSDDIILSHVAKILPGKLEKIASSTMTVCQDIRDSRCEITWLVKHPSSSMFFDTANRKIDNVIL